MRRRTDALIICLGILSAAGLADDWPQWRGPRRDGVWRETGITETLTAPLPVQWRVPIGPGYNGPTVADGRVFVMDRVREPTPGERIVCLDFASGSPLWSYTYTRSYAKVGYPAGPRAAVTVNRGLAYAFGTLGDLHCLDAATGEVRWHRDLRTELDAPPPTWGFAAAPLVEGDRVILQVGGRPGACLVALDRKTGRERWRALDERASYVAPQLIEQAGRRVLLAWTGDSVSALDPATGTVLWHVPFEPRRMIMNIADPVRSGDRLFCSAFFDGAFVLRLDPHALRAERLWTRHGRNERQTDALHACIGTPVIADGRVYGIDSYGELRCLDLETGDRLWEDTTLMPRARWATAHIVGQADRYWILTERGDLVLAHLSPQGFTELGRAPLLAPTTEQLGQRGGVCWSHPAFAGRCVVARSDREILCADLAATP